MIIIPYVLPERRPALDKVVDFFVDHDFEWHDIMSYLVAYARYKIENSSFIPMSKSQVMFVTLAEKIDVKPNGDMNYILFKYCKYHVNPSYNNYKKFIGVIFWGIDFLRDSGNDYKDEFREAAEWVRIKLLIPYEEQKILENGDV